MTLSRKVTIREVAQHANVSIGTVSRALKNQNGLSDDTREEILRAAQTLGYDTGNLRQTRIKRLGFFTWRMPDLLVNPFYSPVLHGVEDACSEQEIVLSYTAFRPSDKVLEIIRRHEVDALLCVSYFQPKLLEKIASLGVQVLLVDHFHPSLTSVNIDNIGGAKKAVQHLLELGRKRIAYVNGMNHHSIVERARGFRQALFEAGMPADPSLEVNTDPHFDIAEVQKATEQLLALAVPPDAIFVFNDKSALVVQRVCIEAGFRVPQDIAIVGFDDIDAASHARPSLSTVRVSKEELGRRAVQMLVNREENSLVVPVELIVRGSSLAKKQK